MLTADTLSPALRALMVSGAQSLGKKQKVADKSQASPFRTYFIIWFSELTAKTKVCGRGLLRGSIGLIETSFWEGAKEIPHMYISFNNNVYHDNDYIYDLIYMYICYTSRLFPASIKIRNNTISSSAVITELAVTVVVIG